MSEKKAEKKPGKMPMVAIVGRPNVGKSSLLNALVGKRISIVQDMPGVTRDRISIPWQIDGRFIELVDTGGYGFVDPDQLTEHIKHQIEIAMARADLVLLVVDTQVGLTGADEQMASMLRRKGIKTILIANKADGPKADPSLGDFARVGFGTPIGVSAMNNRNIDLLTNEIRRNVDLKNAPKEVPEPELMVAIVGKRNAGKSTLVNAIAKLYEGEDERVIVSEVPGTTRDSIDVRFEKEGHAMTVIDTAGVRKKRRMVTNDIEFYSFHRAQRSIRRADVVLMLINGDEHVSEPDKKLAEYVAEQQKPVVLVVNKWDLVLKSAEKQAEERGTEFSSDLLMEEFGEYLTQELGHVDYAPLVFTTAKDGKNVQQVLDLAQHLFKQGNIRVGTGELNRVVKTILEERSPSSPTGRRVRLYYATQTDVAPPTIVLFVNNADYVNESYKRFMVNRFRELLPFDEVPIRLVIRSRVRGGPGGEEGMDEHRSPEARKRTKPKPHPKKAAKRGPARGTRPRR